MNFNLLEKELLLAIDVELSSVELEEKRRDLKQFTINLCKEYRGEI
jgi:hypothetical protein|tara:strand:+ start:1032 stop:1169 length:138 start_codon:yes stop_codon:yes gene_type:complete